MMYQEISNRKDICYLYTQKLIKDGVVTHEQAKEIWDKEVANISEAYSESLKESFDIKKWSIPNYHRVVDFSKLG